MNSLEIREFQEICKIKENLKDIRREKIKDKLKNINTTELINELISRLNIPIFGLCNLCCLEKKQICYFDLEKHSEKIGDKLFCKKCTIKMT